MEPLFKIIILIAAIVGTGLTAGLCFTWGNAVTPGIGNLNSQEYLLAFQQMNRAIINPIFMVVFFGPVVLISSATYLFRNSGIGFWLLLVAALLFFVGVVLVTIFGNVPLNEILDKSNLAALSKIELQELRNKFESPWNQWHTIRTITSFLSFVLLLIGLVYVK